jgi:hypothetical protein
MQDTLEIFRRQFFKWTIAHNKPSKHNPAGYKVEPADLYAQLRGKKRIPDECLRRIGAAFHDGWLKTAPDGYSVVDPKFKGRKHAMIYRRTGEVVIPTWELYVQLADYAHLRFIAQLLEMDVRLEHQEMDLTVWSGDRMVLYVENKESSKKASTLVQEMQVLGDRGFDLVEKRKPRSDRKSKDPTDPHKKASYLFQTSDRFPAPGRPPFFAISTVDKQELFSVEYLGGNHRFRLNSQSGGIAAGLVGDAFCLGVAQKGPVFALAIELERRMQEFSLLHRRLTWLSPGSKSTIFNLYSANEKGTHGVAVGGMESGKLWSDLTAIDSAVAVALREHLLQLGVQLRLELKFPEWRRVGERKSLELSANDVEPFAAAVIAAVRAGFG